MLDKQLILIGKKCINLKSFRIESRDVFKIKAFENFGDFYGIQKLCVEVLKETNNANLGSIESLKNCKNLIHLELEIHSLMDQNLENIHLFLPNLKSFKSIYSTPGITDKSLIITLIINLSKLENIVSLYFLNRFRNPIVLIYLIESFPKLQSISIFLSRISNELKYLS
jgi:hypothetical protein